MILHIWKWCFHFVKKERRICVCVNSKYPTEYYRCSWWRHWSWFHFQIEFSTWSEFSIFGRNLFIVCKLEQMTQPNIDLKDFLTALKLIISLSHSLSYSCSPNSILFQQLHICVRRIMNGEQFIGCLLIISKNCFFRFVSITRENSINIYLFRSLFSEFPIIVCFTVFHTMITFTYTWNFILHFHILLSDNSQ